MYLPQLPIGDGLISLISELSSSLMKGENCCRAFELDAGELLIGDWLFRLPKLLPATLEPSGECGELDRRK